MRALSFTLLLLLPATLTAENWSQPVGGEASPEGFQLGIAPLKFGSGMTSIPMANAGYLHRFEADFDSLPGDLSADEASAFVPILPMSFNDFRVVMMLNYRVTWWDTSETSIIPDEALHAFRVPVVALYDLSDKWLLGGMVMPGYSGDGGSGSDGFSIMTVLGAGYSYSRSLTLFFGGMYSHGFDEDLVVPGVGLFWVPSREWSVSILPPFATVRYKFGNDVMLSLFGRYSSPTWSVESDRAGPDRDINVREVRVGLRLEYPVLDRWWAFVAGGMSMARELDVETTSGRSIVEDDIDSGPFLQLGVNGRF